MCRLLTALLVLPLLGARIATADIVAVPDRLDLGLWAADTTVSCTVHLVNDGERPVDLRAVATRLRSPDLEPDGPRLVDIELAPATLGPHGFLRLELDVHAAPIVGLLREMEVVFTHELGETVVPVRIEAVRGVATRSEHDRPWAGSILFLPSQLYFENVGTSTEVTGSAWFVNDSSETETAAELKPRCGCVGAELGLPTLLPGQASRVDLSARGSARPNDKATSVLFVMESGHLLELPMLIRSIDPRQKRVVDYHRARDASDVDAARAQLDPECRVFFESRDGDGAPPQLENDGPWAGWDRVLRSTRLYRDYQHDDTTVSVIMSETNDFHRLLGRRPTERLLTYRFAPDGLIRSILIQKMEPVDPPPDQLGAFLAWSGREHSAELATIFPERRIVPGEDNARRWQRLLLEWRRAE